MNKYVKIIWSNLRNVVYYKGKLFKRWNMLKTRSKYKSNMIKLCALFLFPFSLFGGLALKDINSAQSNAEQTAVDYVTTYQENVSVTNSSFTEGGSPIAQGNSLTGWTAIETSSSASGMFIDVGNGTDEDGNNSTFSRYQSTYMLEANPGSSGEDSRVMMINSKSASSDKNVNARKGYRSNSITLEANSYYRLVVSAKTALNGDNNVSASIYLSGLLDKDGETFSIGYENLRPSNWTEYFIFIATGDESQTVTIDLYLGSANGAVSSGAVFFDEIYLTRYSENAFFETCLDYGYQGQDTYQSFNNNSLNQSCFLVEGLQASRALIDLPDYNLDFEDDLPSLSTGDKWTTTRSTYAHALIRNVSTMSPTEFSYLTNYTYVGDDLSYGNNNALILYTSSQGGYVQVQSQDIEIQAHAVYKVSLKMKVAGTGISSGSFYLRVDEADTIYTIYPNLVSSSEDDDLYYELNSAQTNGYTSNVDNNFTNDYQTIEFYIKGHPFYNSAVNLNLCLGDSETNAVGCVVVDDIQIEYASYEDFSSATDKLELTSISGTPSGISNPYFNSTEISDDQINAKTEQDPSSISYPLPATSWTTTIDNARTGEQGVIYLYDSETYRNMYTGKYSWARAYPGHPTNTTDVTLPNNVYMIYNQRNGSQSVTSSSYTLSGGSIYKLTFDYLTEKRISSLNDCALTIDIIDGNGITIYTQTGLSSASWSNMAIYIRTAETVSSSLQVRISLGTEDNLASGVAYLDNFIITQLNSTEDGADNSAVIEEFENAPNKADLTDYYLSMASDGEVTSEIKDSPAYSLAVSESYDDNLTSTDNVADFAIGGIVSGKENAFVYDLPDLSINDSNYLVISSHRPSTTTLSSAFTLSLEEGSYYKFSFDLATIFGINADDADNGDHDCKYGVTVTIEGFDSVERLLTYSELESFSLFMHCTSATNPTITFSLVSDCNQTMGTMLVTRLDLQTISETDYNDARISSGYNKTTYIINQTSSTEDDATDDDTDDDTTTDDTTPSENNVLLMISSILMGLALIVAIVGYLLKHVKIKKIDRIKKESYDKKIAINHDAILVEAQKVRDEEYKQLQQAKEILQQEKEKIEKEHEDYVSKTRVQAGSKITREMDTAFKQYNYDINKINQKIDIINEKLDFTMSAEHLLVIERNIVAQQEDRYYQDKREYKKERKKQLKIAKKQEKDKKSKK